MTVDNLEIPPNATIRHEYVKCGQNSHGPYLYAYSKHDKKLNKKYVGKNFEHFAIRKIAKEVKLKPSISIKFKGNPYLDKLRKEEASIVIWAHRVLISSNRHNW
jgi:hypothetical protein